MQHRGEGFEDPAHLWRACSGNSSGRSISCTMAVLSASKISNSPRLVFGAVDREIVEADHDRHRGQRAVVVARRKAVIEAAHEVGFFETLALAEGHLPALRYQMSQRSAMAIWRTHRDGRRRRRCDICETGRRHRHNRRNARQRIPAPAAAPDIRRSWRDHRSWRVRQPACHTRPHDDREIRQLGGNAGDARRPRSPSSANCARVTDVVAKHVEPFDPAEQAMQHARGRRVADKLHGGLSSGRGQPRTAACSIL